MAEQIKDKTGIGNLVKIDATNYARVSFIMEGEEE